MRGRRQFLMAGAALLVAPAVARAQSTQRIPRIGLVSPTAPGPRSEAFVRGLRELGYVDGGNVRIEMRFAQGRPERLPGLVDELIRANVDILVVGATIGARAAKAATTTIPIVFAGSSDPVAAGIVANLSRPGGNITGNSLAYGDGFAGKWLELLKDAVPGTARVAVLWSSSNATAEAFVREIDAAARASKVKLDAFHAANPSELDAAFAAIARSDAQALIVIPSPFAATQADRLVGFAASRRLPAIYFDEQFADVGGLMSYGPSIADAYRRAAAYVVRILKGAKPGDLPVEQPTKFDLVVNLDAARALGLGLSRAFLLRADRVIG
ncbi:MAG: ABC transporter substrate-binding protein [Burkholderiales bacterium]